MFYRLKIIRAREYFPYTYITMSNYIIQIENNLVTLKKINRIRNIISIAGFATAPVLQIGVKSCRVL